MNTFLHDELPIIIVSYIHAAFFDADLCCCMNSGVQVPHVTMCQPIFTVGHGSNYDLSVEEHTVSKSLCKLKHTEIEVNTILFACS